jgi:acetylornithine/LysW-gamma-L-lysine aminotransferase
MNVPTALPQDIETEAEVRLYNKRDITLVRGDGVHLYDREGRRYLDAMSNYGVNVLGHRHPAVDSAVRHQLDQLISCHQSFYNDARAEFERVLLRMLPPELCRIAFANSGTEAIEAAMKFARIASGRQRIIAAEHAYHGRTFGALSVTHDPKYRDPFRPLLDGCEHVAYDDLDALEAILPGAAAVILEPIQGEAGVRVPSKGYLAAVRELCDRHGALLILDEVQTGIGRTGKLFAFEHEGVVADILAVSKGLANGLPIGVTVVRQEVADKVPTGSHGSTFAGNPLACAAARATLQTVGEQHLLDHVAESGAWFVAGLNGLSHPLVLQVRGRGLMVAAELKTRATAVLKAMQREGVLALPAGNRTIRFLPPLIMTRDELDRVVEVFRIAADEQRQ